MKDFKKLWICTLMFVMMAALSLGLTNRAQARPIVEFNLTNHTGLNMHALYIAPAIPDTPWSTNMLGDGPIKDAETVKVGFQPNADVALWDVKMIDQDGKEYLWGKLELLDCTGVTIYLKDGKAIADVKIPVD